MRRLLLLWRGFQRDVELPELPASVNAHDAVSPVSSPAKPKGKVKVSPSPAKQVRAEANRGGGGRGCGGERS